MAENNKNKPVSDETRERRNAYLREYRRKNPARARQWHENYVLKKAAKLMAATRSISTDAAQDGPQDAAAGEGGQVSTPTISGSEGGPGRATGDGSGQGGQE